MSGEDDDDAVWFELPFGDESRKVRVWVRVRVRVRVRVSCTGIYLWVSYIYLHRNIYYTSTGGMP